MREEKQLLLDEIKDYIEENSSFIIMRYEALNASMTTNFRDTIYKCGGFVEMVKKRVLVKAAQEAGVDLNVEDLPGHIGIVFGGEDPLETTKATFKFRKDNGKAIDVLCGRFEGELHNAQTMETLSKLPGKDEMRAQLLSVFEAPQSQTLGVMDALLTSVIHCLNNKAEQES